MDKLATAGSVIILRLDDVKRAASTSGIRSIRQGHLRIIGSTLGALLLILLFVHFSSPAGYGQAAGNAVWGHAPSKEKSSSDMVVGKMIWTDDEGNTYNATEVEQKEAKEKAAKESEQDNETTTGIPNASEKQALEHTLDIFPPPPPADDEEHLAMCTFGKNVHKELREYLTHYYYHHGIRRFYIYDDGSDIPLAEHAGYDDWPIPAKHLNFTRVPPGSIPPHERVRLQGRIHKECLQSNAHKHTWMGDMDMDEFIEMRSTEYPTLKGWLKSFEDVPKVGAVSISMLPHNNAGHIDIQEDGFRRSFNVCLTNSFHAGDWGFMTQTKVWVRTDLDVYADTHYAILPEGLETMDETRGRGGSPLEYNYWALHHYATGSRRYFEGKMHRGRTDHMLAKEGKEQVPITEDYWAAYHSRVETYECLEMTKYRP